MAYIDTSVLAAYYCPERLSARAQKALRSDPDPVISALVELELHSAVAAKVRGLELSMAAANQIVSLFRLHVADGCFRVVPIEPREYALACRWIGGFSTALRTLDALHLAAAFANNLTLLTADRALARSATHLGVTHELIG